MRFLRRTGLVLLVALAPLLASTGPAPGVAAKPRTAAQVLDALKKAGMPVTGSVTYTAKTDPNTLLGRPGGYTSKVNFKLKGLPPLVAPADPFDIEAGGTIEVYASPRLATNRAKYLLDLMETAPVFGTSYMTRVDSTVMRISRVLTPEEAAPYGKMLARAVKV